MPKNVTGERKTVKIDLSAAMDEAGFDKYQLAAHVERDPKTIDNWIDKGEVKEKDFIKIEKFMKQHSHHWLWRMDEEPNTDNWIIKQAIYLLRDAIIAEGEERQNKLGHVITVCDADEHPLEGGDFDHSHTERLMIGVLKARALYFTKKRSKEGEALYIELGKKADVVLDAVKKNDQVANNFSLAYLRAAVEAKLGKVMMEAESGECSYEEERDCLRELSEIVKGFMETGRYIYPELLAKLRWNEANCHCENGPDTLKYADVPIRDLINLHGPRLVFSLIKKDKIVSKALDVPVIAEMLGYAKASAA